MRRKSCGGKHTGQLRGQVHSVLNKTFRRILCHLACIQILETKLNRRYICFNVMKFQVAPTTAVGHLSVGGRLVGSIIPSSLTTLEGV